MKKPTFSKQAPKSLQQNHTPIYGKDLNSLSSTSSVVVEGVHQNFSLFPITLKNTAKHLFQNYSLKWIFGIFLFLIFSISALNAQTKGLIYKPAAGGGQAVLDPNNDGYTSADTTGFVTDDEVESEIPYTPLPSVGAAEPDSDLGPGPSCGFTDLVKSDDNNTIYTYLDASDNLMFRFRLGGTANNSKGYSILIDTDQKFGATGPDADPNYVPGNPGFEIEVVLRTNFGVGLYNVDGTLSPVAMDDETVARPYDNYAQKSIALSEICGDDDYFYDFYIPFSDITFYFPAVTTATPLRMVGNTVINPKAALGNNGISDLGGIDDSTGITDNLWGNLVDVFPPTSPIDIGTGTTLSPRAACPSITGPIALGATSISGTSTEVEGATIEVFRAPDNVSAFVSVGTTTVTAGASPRAWSITGLTAAVGGEVFKATATVSAATATATGTSQKSASYSTCNISTVGATCSPAPTGISEATGNKDFVGSTTVTGTYTLTVYDGTGSLLSGIDANPLMGLTGPTWVWTYGSGGTKIPDGTYYFTIQETSTSACESDQTLYCNVATNSSITFTTDPNSTSTSLDGTAIDGATVTWYKDDVEQASTTYLVQLIGHLQFQAWSLAKS